MNRLAQYGAVAAKVRSLWGFRLRSEDYRRMAAMRTLPELAGYLRAHPRWGRALEGVNFSDIHRFELEEHLRRYHLEEHLRLYPYLDRDDQNLLDFPVLEMELTQIMRYLRLARVGRSNEYTFTPPRYLARRSHINYNALSAASTYDGLIDAVSETGFAAVLRRLKPHTPRSESGIEEAQTAFPPFTMVEVALFSEYFRTQYAMIQRRKDADLRKHLMESVGLEIDLTNIAVVLRIKRYYPTMESQYISFLIPIYHHLRPDMLKRLCAAENTDAALAILRGTRYGQYFQDPDLRLEQLMAQIRYDHGVRGIREPLPSLVTPLSFLYLSQVELSNVIHLIECIRYDVPQEDALTYVVG